MASLMELMTSSENRLPDQYDGARFWLVVSHCDNQALETALKQRRGTSEERDFLGIRLLRFDATWGGG